MLATQLDSHHAPQPKPFIGVRFVLFGFESINQHQVKSKLVNGGGVDVGQYTQDCTHVIVNHLAYDDPVCVAARKDRKILVTGLWVDQSFDIGMPVDHTSIMYRPLKDLNGIPGAKSFIMCLTGYQRQDRDDVMTMVGLMGAQFSKPLVANKVTHLICYKFEGEKYELAKKLKKIKLVNHKWLEDCLSSWQILAEVNYSKSGYELEMETEAKDSEEEAEDNIVMQFRGRTMNLSPCSLQVGMPKAHELYTAVGAVSKIPLDTTVPIGPSILINHEDIPSVTGKDTSSGQASSLNTVNEKLHGALDCQKNQNSTIAEQPDHYGGTPISTKVGSDLAFPSASAKKSIYSGVGKFSGKSYSRKTPRRLSLQTEISNNLSSFPKIQSGELETSGGLDISPSKAQKVMDRNGFGCFNTPHKESGLLHEEEFAGLSTQKRKMDAYCASSKSQKLSHDSIQCNSVSPSAGNEVPRSELTPLTYGPSEINKGLSVNNNGTPRDDPSLLNPAKQSHADMFRTKSSSYKRKSSNLPVSETMTSEIGQDSYAEKVPQNSFGKSEEPVDIALRRSVHEVGGIGELHNLQLDVDASSPNYRAMEFAKSHSPVTLRGEKNVSLSKPVEKRASKKSLGSKPKPSSSSKANTANQNGSIYLDRTASQNDAAVCPVGGKGTVSHEEPSSANKLEVPSCLNTIETLMEMNTRDAPKSGNDNENKNESVDGETEAPDDKYDELEKAVNQRHEVAEVTQKPDIMMEEASEEGQHITKASTDNATALEGYHEKEVDGKKIELGESTCTTDAVRGKMTKGKKRPLGKSKINTVSAVTKNLEYERNVDGDETRTKNICETSQIEERGPNDAAKAQSNTVLINKLDNNIELQKENKPMIIGNKSMLGNKQCVGKVVVNSVTENKVAVKSNRIALKTNQKAGKVDPDSMQLGGAQKKVKAEPVWFILSGNRLQRKEFQKITRQLKGRICRDSHQWSYQATHFIAPDPIRRTEKFFAAAASGRWILKSDYLSASSRAGKFLAEEPYEWHKNCLSEDGAINLEAPQKWRLLREKTGHGAFYGMHIIIYGDCIAPPLDTLKRAVKAGDGTILATSPPYTRFFDSGVDFAVVSPGMPRADMWVQEFLKHEVPCVVADYLVEYVCKPGYSIEKHVQFNTHAWADKSLARLMSRSEEIVQDLTPPDENDLTCQVCGSSDRGEVMLFCGNEPCSIGCGVGTHIDCCNPPLEEVPQEDWFCPKCRSKNSSSPSKNSKKRTSKGK